MLKHIWEGVVESLASIIASFGECTVSRGCKWVAWPLGICCALPVLMCSEALGLNQVWTLFLCLLGLLDVQVNIGKIVPHLSASESKKLDALIHSFIHQHCLNTYP